MPMADGFFSAMHLLVPFVLAMFIGLSLSRIRRPWPELRSATLMTALAAWVVGSCSELMLAYVRPTTTVNAVFGIEPTFWQTIVGPAFLALLLAAVLAATCIMTIVTIQSTAIARRSFRTFQKTLVIVVTFLTFFVSLAFSEFLAPYDTWPVEMRPPYPDLSRIANDLFETPIAALLITGTVLWLLARRIDKHRRSA
jgi:hypothetical protein